MFDEGHGDCDVFTWGIVKRKAWQIVRRSDFLPQDQADIEQQLLLKVVQGMAAFNPTRGHSNAFVTTIVERAVANVIRHNCAEKRDPARVCSLNAPMNEDGREVDLAATVGHREYDARRQCAPRPTGEHAQLVSDVHEVIAALPDRLRQLAEHLQTKTVAQIARETGLARSTINDRISELRWRFERAGLREYL